ncbi:ferredoxin [Streptomyces sp. NPDC050560]|uniref:ferredoxin n=1 Tax=Streptomyces sp. NPDC050560 TaxID=3365630 RepID=UPI00378E6EFB
MTTQRITADTDVCVGAGQCVLTAPDVFDQDEDGFVTVLEPEPSDEQLKAAKMALSICPSRAIGLTGVGE